jgi:ankyrin repeat protein
VFEVSPIFNTVFAFLIPPALVVTSHVPKRSPDCPTVALLVFDSARRLECMLLDMATLDNVVDILIAKGNADVIEAAAQDGKTALILASENNDTSVIELLRTRRKRY